MRHHKIISSAVAMAVAAISVLYFFFYAVREAVAAALIFGIAFGIVWMALLVLFLIPYAALKVLVRLENLVARARVQRTKMAHEYRDERMHEPLGQIVELRKAPGEAAVARKKCA